jgi:hypothetical protein
MKRQTLIGIFALLAIAFNLSCATSSTQARPEDTTPEKSPEQFAAASYTVTGPYSHKNLTIFLLHGRDEKQGAPPLTLQEAMERKKVVVHETGDVNNLSIENVSDEEVYVQSGDIVKGGQQDRVLAMDLIVPPKSGRVPIDSFCVEQGRWSGRGDEAVAMFGSSQKSLNSKELKIAAKHKASQQEVWDKVAKSREKLSAGVVAADVAVIPATPPPAPAAPPARQADTNAIPADPRTTAAAVGFSVASSRSHSSLQLMLENKQVTETADDYLKKLSPIIEGRNDVIGYAFAINGQMNSADVYSSHALFKKLWPKLLEASATEAIGEFEKGKAFKPVDAEAVKAFLSEAERGKGEEREVTSRVLAVKRESEKNLFFETRDRKQKGAWIHRNYIAK